jgi:hypothetical protein
MWDGEDKKEEECTATCFSTLTYFLGFGPFFVFKKEVG